LIEITAGTAPVSVSAKEQKRVYNFTIRVKLVRASEAEKQAAKPADAAASAASGTTAVPAAKS